MPQFDFYSFSEQVLLVLIVFSIFYFFFLKFYLSNFSKTLKIRLKLKNIFENFDNKKNKSQLKSLFL